LVSSQAILKKGIKIEFIQEMNPKIKNKEPIIKIGMIVSCLLKEPTFTVTIFFIIRSVSLRMPERNPKNFIRDHCEELRNGDRLPLYSFRTRFINKQDSVFMLP
jgi:hypothetical protein